MLSLLGFPELLNEWMHQLGTQLDCYLEGIGGTDPFCVGILESPLGLFNEMVLVLGSVVGTQN